MKVSEFMILAMLACLATSRLPMSRVRFSTVMTGKNVFLSWQSNGPDICIGLKAAGCGTPFIQHSEGAIDALFS